MIFYDCVGWIPQILAKNHLPLWMIVWLCLFVSLRDRRYESFSNMVFNCLLTSLQRWFQSLLCSIWFHPWYSCAYIYIYVQKLCKKYTDVNAQAENYTCSYSNLLAPAAIWGTQKEGHVPWCGDSRTGTQGVASSHNGWLVGIIDDD